MNEKEARHHLEHRLTKLMRLSYADLRRLIVDVSFGPIEVAGKSGSTFVVVTDGFIAQAGYLDVSAYVDEKSWRFFLHWCPAIQGGFKMFPDGSVSAW